MTKSIPIIGLGNALLDVITDVTDDYLATHKLAPDGASLASEKDAIVFEDLQKSRVDYCPGGAAQNTIRVVQWMLSAAKPDASAAFFGCVGKDDYGSIMKSSLVRLGIHVEYQVHPSMPTGRCAVLLSSKGRHRCLIAQLNAATEMSADEYSKIDSRVKDAGVVYIEGYLLAPAMDTIKSVILRTMINKGKQTFAFNVSAPYIVQVPEFRARFLEIMPFVDLLFCNSEEAVAFAAADPSLAGALSVDKVETIASYLANFPRAKDQVRTVVVTRGAESTIICKTGGSVEYHEICKIPADQVVDVNGAGDSYAGGYLCGLILGKDAATCAKAGAYAASEVIRRIGCSLPQTPSFAW